MATPVKFKTYEFRCLKDVLYRNFFTEAKGSSSLITLSLPVGTKFMYSHDLIFESTIESDLYSPDSAHCMWTILRDKTGEIKRHLIEDKATMQYGSTVKMRAIGEYIIIVISYCTCHSSYIGNRTDIMKNIKLEDVIYITVNNDNEIIECQKIIQIINPNAVVVEAVGYERNYSDNYPSFHITHKQMSCMPADMVTCQCKIHEVSSSDARKFYKDYRSLVSQLISGKKHFSMVANNAKFNAVQPMFVTNLINPDKQLSIQEDANGNTVVISETIQKLSKDIENVVNTVKLDAWQQIIDKSSKPDITGI